MVEQKDWVVDMAAKLQSYDPVQESIAWKSRSIYKVPSNLINLTKTNAYTPEMVSFGPYHHGRPQLMPMEEHKQRALFHFLRRTSITLEAVVDCIKQVEQQLVNHYDEPPAVAGPSSFAKMMVIDGCFMLEILRMRKGTGDYSPSDPIFSSHGMLYALPYIKRDMLMLENQIPLLVLDRLVAVETGKPRSEEGHVHRLVTDFFSLRPLSRGGGEGLHVLEVFRRGLIEGRPAGLPHPPSEEPELIVRSAVELYEAGIRFKKSKTRSLRDIDFKHGVLRLPRITVDDTAESMLLNLMAYERMHVGAGNEVSSYVSFMDTLIDSAKDVAMLQSKGIILNALGSDKAVAKLFNELSREVTIDPSSKLGEVHRRLGRYSTQKHNMWRANLIHTYFRNPWAILSLVAAVVLLALTIAQTVYSALGYYHDLKK
ncbi:UPF0481 protein At3g47200-like [Nymphaea colorata]|uniref:Uncharacterized protein n=1 Tax=Nymphaea colorata TaxID=210225 RepID=A0A5K1F7S2_9MAGN|nr:UPF0481 protein At3g47200-like [Nymphaea colorata]VVW58680.1 unnamed protein product [Nymphaea colorata]